MADGGELHLLRAGDLLNVRVVLTNVELVGGELRRIDPAQVARITLVLPPQHFREAVNANPFSYVQAAAAAPTKLEVVVPEGTDAVLPPGGLLGLCQSLGVARDSQIYVPARLYLQPLDGRWTLGVSPTRLDGRNDLWRAKLVGPPDGSRAAARFEIAMIFPDSSGPAWDVTPRADELFPTYRGAVMLASRFDFSPWGASVRMRGPVGWAGSPTVPTELVPFLDTYEHDIDYGRDSRVQFLTRGHLSTGHAATVVAVTRRLFFATPGGEGAEAASQACLVRQTHLVVDDPVVRLDHLAPAYRYGGREVPFRELHLTTTDVRSVGQPPEGSAPFVVRTIGGADVEFPLVGIDHAGRPVHFRTSLTFVPRGAAVDPAAVQHQAVVEPQSLTMSPPGDAPPGSTTVTAHGFTLTAVAPLPVDPSLLPAGFAAPLLPTIERFRVAVDAASQFTGIVAVADVELHDRFREVGLDAGANPLGAFLTVPQGLPLPFSARDVGGIAKPDMRIGAVTARKGAVPSAFELGQAPDPQQLVAQFAGAKLLGLVDLAGMIDATRDVDDPGKPLRPPELVQEVLAERVELRYRWKAALSTAGVIEGGARLEPAPGPGRPPPHLDLEAVVTRRAGPGGDQQSRVKGVLHQVDLVVAGVVRLHFDSLEISSAPGAKTQVVPRGMQLGFEGQLAFLEEVTNALEATGLADRSTAEVTPSGISAGFSAAVPSLQVGMFALSNLSVTTQLRVPFDASPATFRFAIAERHNPFSVTVAMFGGGGFFALELDTRVGVRVVEAALEFGGSMQLNIVVASGGVYVMGGIYFRYDAGQGVTISGYLRCGGHLSVLGLVTVSVDFYMQLGYQPDTGKVHGSASLTIGIEVLFFSKTVTLSVERTFAGSGNDPSFTDCYGPEDWEDYCRAFA